MAGIGSIFEVQHLRNTQQDF